MQDEVSKAINEIKEQITELENQITFINSIDFSKPITELRNSNLLGLIVKNIFPEAEDINVHCNYVYFTLLGFEVQIPTSMCRGINVKTDWYIKDDGKPVLEYSPVVERMKEYFELVDNKVGWYERAKVRLTYGKSCKKWVLFLAWWLRYKWKNPHREIYMKRK